MREVFNRIQTHRPWLVITGAGISLGSGIPTYRDHEGNWLRSNPIQHQEFIQYEDKRKRYWARSTLGWPPVSRAQPNNTHFLLAQLEQRGLMKGVITQNVDRLHQKAGHKRVIDLHGRLDRVKCLSCQQYESRNNLQQRLIELNPFLLTKEVQMAPDGDAHLENELTQQMKIANCLHCNGTLMPDVVFFGGTVPKATNLATSKLFDECSGVITIGSSLMVYSGYRFCKLAKQEHKPLIIINQGKTRADDIADFKIEKDCATVLKGLLDHIGG
ncbi:NAD-dependent protein deacetylase [Pleionea sediminis]|uniref:NAD-dependent protein deacetylase n=1 Tax=Pleionea sediminis TaxID=2569479 RepID=UPI001185DDCD|nr:NAD-dependent protein deacetylase [Pleionea sediminis]